MTLSFNKREGLFESIINVRHVNWIQIQLIMSHHVRYDLHNNIGCEIHSILIKGKSNPVKPELAV